MTPELTDSWNERLRREPRSHVTRKTRGRGGGEAIHYTLVHIERCHCPHELYYIRCYVAFIMFLTRCGISFTMMVTYHDNIFFYIYIFFYLCQFKSYFVLFCQLSCATSFKVITKRPKALILSSHVVLFCAL